jgi:hypothetical protein
MAQREDSTADDKEEAARLRAKLPGVWLLASFEVRPEGSDEVRYPFGREPVGTLMYSDEGYMSVQIMASDRLQYPGGTAAAPDGEVTAAARGYVAYSGPFDVTDASTIVHRPNMSLRPSAVGNALVRKAVCDGKRLELRPPPSDQPGAERTTAVLVWERV